MKLTHLKHNSIDKKLWDNKVENSTYTTIYCFSWFLDITSPNWEALVSENYEFIMPLPKSSKYFINYIKRPIQLQKIGIISNKTISNNIAEIFIKNIPSKYKVIDIPFFNKLEIKLNNGFIKKRTNYELNLNKTYEELYKEYSKSHKKNIKKTLKNNLTIVKLFDVDLFLELKQKDANYNIYKKYDKNILLQFKQLLNYANINNLGEIYFVKDNKDKYIAAIFFLIYKNRVIRFSVTSIKKHLGAGFLIIDNFIKTHSSKDLTLDFVGSDIQGVAYFNKGFGSSKTEYSHLYINRLKFPFNLLKK